MAIPDLSSLTEQKDCPFGGTVIIDAFHDVDVDLFNLDGPLEGTLHLDQDFKDCVVESDQGDKIKLNGILNSKTKYTLNITQNDITGEAIAKSEGKLNVEGDNIEPGVCGISMDCLLYTSPSPRDRTRSRMPSSA